MFFFFFYEMTFSLLFTENTHSTLFFLGFLFLSPSLSLDCYHIASHLFGNIVMCTAYSVHVKRLVFSFRLNLCAVKNVANLFCRSLSTFVLLRCCYCRYVMWRDEKIEKSSEIFIQLHVKTDNVLLSADRCVSIWGYFPLETPPIWKKKKRIPHENL